MKSGLRDVVARAEEVLSGGGSTTEELLQLVKSLRAQKEYSYARRVIDQARRSPGFDEDLELRVRIALLDSQLHLRDQTLPVKYRLERAFQILVEHADLARTDDPEVLGTAGAIFKRKWEAEGQLLHLHRALAYYTRGYRAGGTKDFGYNAINVAFLNDLIASQEAEEAYKAGGGSASAEARRAEAERMRTEAVRDLPPLRESEPWLDREFWFHLTVAEAYFGLGRYDEARPWLQRAKGCEPPEWQVEVTARQFATIARLRGSEPKPHVESEHSHALKVLSEFVGQEVSRDTFAGKIGLALSGGGFRASLFHIGVLARLADLDLLRRVEVLSCVSGGSVVGAYYYLEVRKLLQSKSDEEVTQEDYIGIVERTIDNFLAGVQRNIRTRVFANSLINLKMMLLNYPATLRLGELFESELFARVDDGEAGRARFISELAINPLGERADFDPGLNNWRRSAKVPELILNATSLNSGHNWQFTVSWMGESAGSQGGDSAGAEYRPTYYAEAPEAYRKYRLGHAVAASACVPGLFGPIEIKGVGGEETVRLVDGGVYDNQGAVALLDRGCSVVLVSDASGQFSKQKAPAGGLIGAAIRSNEIQMRLVRDSIYRELISRRQSYLLRGVMFLHLRKDLEDDAEGDHPAVTSYGMPSEVQKRLAAIRTDLDSFNQVEAYALMASGYMMTQVEFRHGSVEGFAEPVGDPPRWKFLQIDDVLRNHAQSEPGYRQLLRLLDVGAHRFGKVFMVPHRGLIFRLIDFVVPMSAVGILLWLLWLRWDNSIITVHGSGLFIALVLLLVFAVITAFLWKRNRLEQAGISLLFYLMGSMLMRFHLTVADRMYLRLGSLNQIRRLNESARTLQREQP